MQEIRQRSIECTHDAPCVTAFRVRRVKHEPCLDLTDWLLIRVCRSADDSEVITNSARLDRCWVNPRHYDDMRVAVGLFLSAVAIAGCANQSPATSPAPTTTLTKGAAAVWQLAPRQDLTGSATRFTALVTRIACNNGVTGEVFAPGVRVK